MHLCNEGVTWTVITDQENPYRIYCRLVTLLYPVLYLLFLTCNYCQTLSVSIFGCSSLFKCFSASWTSRYLLFKNSDSNKLLKIVPAFKNTSMR